MTKGFLSLLLFSVLGTAAYSATVDYTSSTAFLSATQHATVAGDDFSSTTGFTVAQIITPGSTFNGITYSSFQLTGGATNGIITDRYSSFRGTSLGADHTDVDPANTYFLPHEGVTLKFASPVYAFGVFFNVGLNSGSYGFSSSNGSAMTTSGNTDALGFVFAGLISTTPISTAVITGDNDYTVPGLLSVNTALSSATPEPATAGLIAAATLAVLVLGARRKRLTLPE